ncbi:hypothetical protein [Marispirochaeta aestuarii]|nr:hypothetical protein [Marispirochaeta aestuarii]
MSGFMCFATIYEFNGWTFEYGYGGPWPIRKDGELYKRRGEKFLNDIAGFLKLSDEEKQKYKVGGGCQRF